MSYAQKKKAIRQVYPLIVLTLVQFKENIILTQISFLGTYKELF